MKITTEEQIQEALKVAGITIDDDCFYEISSSSFGKVLELPKFRSRIQKYKIEGETRVSYICGIKKINKKNLTYTDRYTGCTERVIWGKDLIEAIWLCCNKYSILEELRISNNVTLYKELYAKLSG